MTDLQRRFVDAYMGEAKGNATEAARLAGYSGDDAALAVRGSENVRNRKVRQALRELQASDPLVASREERQAFWTAIMRGEEPADLGLRIKASELLGKTGGDFVERHEHTGADGKPLAVTWAVVHTATPPAAGGADG